MWWHETISTIKIFCSTAYDGVYMSAFVWESIVISNFNCELNSTWWLWVVSFTTYVQSQKPYSVSINTVFYKSTEQNDPTPPTHHQRQEAPSTRPLAPRTYLSALPGAVLVHSPVAALSFFPCSSHSPSCFTPRFRAIGSGCWWWGGAAGNFLCVCVCVCWEES